MYNHSLSDHWNELCMLHSSSAISISNCCSDPYYFEQVSVFARNWPQDRIRQVRRELSASNPFRESVMRDLLELENEIPNMKYSWED